MYSLEQSKESLRLAANNFGLKVLAKDDNFVDFADIPDDRYSTKAGSIYLCHFSPLPLSTREAHAAFEDRFSQLSHMITKLRQEAGSGRAALFIIDSLNAIATSAPERTDIYRLFSVFRSQRIPLVITAERQEFAPSSTTNVSEAARFLADVVIELTKDTSAGHLLQYLEISKSRVQRQSLGRHLYKVRTVGPTRKRKGGIQVYRSMPYVISAIRPEGKHHQSEEYVIHAAGNSQGDLGVLYPKQITKAGHCFALLGSPGTNKLAVALNLAAGYRRIGKRRIRKILIISFGGMSATNMEEIAWFEQRDFWRSCPTLKGKQSEKWWWATSRGNTTPASDGGPSPSADQLTFRLGHLTPEECFDCIAEATKEPKYSAVVLSDTAEISAGFPLLRRDPLFIPALIDLFRIRGLTSVCIGVQTENTQNLEMDFALQSCADCRLYFTHYPNAYDLAKQAFDKQSPGVPEPE